MTSVNSGGYQTGKSYLWYRSMGHNPLSAGFMVYGNRILYVEILVASAILGFLLGDLICR